MAMTDVSAEKLDIGRVFQLAIEIGKRRFVRLAALWGIAIAGVIAFGVLLVLVAGGTVLTDIIAGGRPSLGTLQKIWPIFGFGVIVIAIFSAVVQAASFSVAIGDLAGRTTTLEEDLKLGLRKFGPLLAVSILFSIAVFFGFMLLVVPGIMIALAFSQALPATVSEKIGIMQAFDRSRFLTRNNRWRLLGLWAVVGLAYIVLSIVLGALTGGLAMRESGAAAGIGVFASNIIESLVASIAGYCLQAAAYAELRRIKDGAGAADLGEVFD
jgi:hypothetical protein